MESVFDLHNQELGHYVKAAGMYIPRVSPSSGWAGDNTKALVPLPVAFSNITSGVVTSVQMVHPGGKYATAPTVTFTAIGAGSGATGTAVIDANGNVVGVRITDGGSLYAVPPAVSFSAGTLATGYLREDFSAVQSLNMSNAAAHYSILRLTGKVKALRLAVLAEGTPGTIKVHVGFFNNTIWTPDGSTALAVNRNDMFEYPHLHQLVLAPVATYNPNPIATVEVPQGIFRGKGAVTDAFAVIHKVGTVTAQVQCLEVM